MSHSKGMKTIEINGRKVRVDVFRSESNARSWADRCGKTWVVQGDAGEFWTTSPANAARLERAGYEIV